MIDLLKFKQSMGISVLGALARAVIYRAVPSDAGIELLIDIGQPKTILGVLATLTRAATDAKLSPTSTKTSTQVQVTAIINKLDSAKNPEGNTVKTGLGWIK